MKELRMVNGTVVDATESVTCPECDAARIAGRTCPVCGFDPFEENVDEEEAAEDGR